MKMDNKKILEISDLVCKAAGCKITWGLGNHLLVTAGGRRQARDEPSGADIGSEAHIHEVKWDTDMHLPLTRKLVNETCSIFVQIQRQMAVVETPANRSNLILKYSREYRSVIKACIMELHLTLRSCSYDLEKTCADQLEMLEMSELLWSLCEILLIDTLPGGLVIKHLLDWWQSRFLDYDEKARAVVQAGSTAFDEGYWQAVIFFVLQGRLDDARHMLSLHPQFSTVPFRALDELLKSMPINLKLNGAPSSELEMRWQAWNSECKRLRAENLFLADSNLLLISRILAGEEQVFWELRELLGTWYCMLISKLLYTNPTILAADLQYHVHDCIIAYGSLSTLRPWDSIMLAAMEIDILQVVQRCSTEFSNWWLVSHLTDLLSHHGILKPHVHSFGSNLREFLIVEYAVSLLSHHSLWQVGVTYLENCSGVGRNILADFVECFPIECEKKAYKVLNICEKNELHDRAKKICKTLGVQALHNNCLGSALLWGLKSKDAAFVAHVSEKYLNEYCGSGSFSNTDLIDNLGSSMLMSTKLTFLGKYREFHQMYARGRLSEAAAILLSLLTARIAPTKYWSVLLLDSLPLLEASQLILNSQQTYELLHCLEELDLIQNLGAVHQGESRRFDSDKLSILRLALARNLARAIVEEDASAN